MSTPPQPAALWLVRHGESAANVARNAAFAAGAEEVAIAQRDPDVPLSALGGRQATALGRWFASRSASERPTVVLASPYERARATAEHIVRAGAPVTYGTFGVDDILVDERWREKELGLFFRVTQQGVERRYPEQWALREELGAFYYRPPNGESGADVVLRVRAAIDALKRDHAGERVLVVCHQITILCARYVLERLTEAELDAAWRRYDIGNCSLTEYRPGADGRLALTRLAYTVPVEEGAPDVAGDEAPVTAEPPAGTIAGRAP
jgi:broad specificity phosphatase PhoE